MMQMATSCLNNVQWMTTVGASKLMDSLSPTPLTKQELQNSIIVLDTGVGIDNNPFIWYEAEDMLNKTALYRPVQNNRKSLVVSISLVSKH